MEEKPSDRIIDQRIRNRIIEAVHTLAQGNDGVLAVWPTEYFESFYDWIPYGGQLRHPNSTISAEEQARLSDVSRLLDQACDATPQIMTADELIASGWPELIQPVAQEALRLMLKRGLFSEDQVEEEPSSNGLS
ncbi:hypothetical protein RFM23_14130 [Mesorhizobium abyssinicae]|uniref:Uncharacterized protein n=1 Tax=Mesorhizobium abyssinicae TaxID=1209958 RepID=A0ABU5AN90_9HYPH|nr:hypothetical protein [Mesorhizobium abyssinicae]MDX8538756.1 hypothetical protein [Mesorhizobium abyssinicae]